MFDQGSVLWFSTCKETSNKGLSFEGLVCFNSLSVQINSIPREDELILCCHFLFSVYLRSLINWNLRFHWMRYESGHLGSLWRSTREQSNSDHWTTSCLRADSGHRIFKIVLVVKVSSRGKIYPRVVSLAINVTSELWRRSTAQGGGGRDCLP